MSINVSNGIFFPLIPNLLPVFVHRVRFKRYFKFFLLCLTFRNVIVTPQFTFVAKQSRCDITVIVSRYVMNRSRRRRRRLAGHLFQDRWEDQGRWFILLPPWPPNCLGQMLTVRDFSQHLVSSSKTIRPNIPRGARCMGHCEMM